MNKPPRWFTVVAVVALLWNLIGLIAVVSDARLSAEDVAKLPQNQQAMYEARPGWSVIASLTAVVGGVLGCLGLLVRTRWAQVALYASLAGVIVQDIGMFGLSGAASLPLAVVMQGLVLVIAVGLVMLGRLAHARSWLS